MAVFSWLADGGRSAAPNGLTNPKSFLKSSPQVRNALDERNMCTPPPVVRKRAREYPKCKLYSHVGVFGQGLNFLGLGKFLSNHVAVKKQIEM